MFSTDSLLLTFLCIVRESSLPLVSSLSDDRVYTPSVLLFSVMENDGVICNLV